MGIEKKVDDYLMREIERLSAELEKCKRFNAEWISQSAKERTESQAYAERLREGFQAIQATSGHDSGSYQAAYVIHKKIAERAIAIPADHSALTERLAQERAKDRERIIVLVVTMWAQQAAPSDIANAIRALRSEQ